MLKIVFVDTYYPEIFKKPELQSIPDETMDYPYGDSIQRRQIQLDKLHFGTSYYYSKSFKQMGWEAIDVVVNDPLTWPDPKMRFGIISALEPDIIYCQDLHALSPQDINTFKARGVKVVAQHSCPWAGDDTVRQYDIVFTSFPHYLERIKNVGTRSHFLPIAFGHWVLDYIPPVHRDIDICFVGGINGSSGHWSKGTQLLEEVAKNFPEQFQWWGYSIGNMAQWPNLSRSYRGEAWGLEMYRILARSKIVINRHGEVAEGFSNNMRMFEATGMGATLLTEHSDNLHKYFIPGVECLGYYNISHLIVQLQDNWPWETLAYNGQARTLKDHTYEKRLKEIEPILKELIK